MNHITRLLQKTISKRIGENKVLLLYGTRRVGKTKLLEALKAELSDNCLLLNAEDFDVQRLLAQRSYTNYQRIIGNNSVLMIDEAQSIPDIGGHLKFMIDSFPNLTIIATGSSSFDLMNKSGEPLTGRSYQYFLYPISFSELMQAKDYPLAIQHINECMIYGSYPELFRLSDGNEKELYLKELVQTYLLKDIFMYETVKNSIKIFDLLKLLAFQMGSEVSTDELGRKLGMSKNTVARYLDLLTKVFIIFRVGGFSSNLRKEVVKSSKWYFYDNGIRNAIISDFRQLANRNDSGQLWENYCFSERIKSRVYAGRKPEYYFWRTYAQQEIDMIEKDNSKLQAFEFKFEDNRRSGFKIPKIFQSTYPEASVHLITKESITEFLL